MKIVINLIFLLFIAINIAYSQSTFKSVNFQCGGYVTNVVPAYNSTGTMSTQILYARTDIGGVYKSTNNGDNWISINNYLRTGDYITTSDLSVQGIAIHPTNTNIVTIAVGNYREEDHPTGSMFRSTNGGTSWSTVSLPSQGMIFRGNNFAIKIGGECIKYNPTNALEMFAGGGPPQGASQNYLYRSADGGLNWSRYDDLSLSTNDTIISIQFTSDGSELWVGTTNGLYRRTSNGWTTQTNNFGGFPYARRILLKNSGNNIIAYIAYNNNPTVATDIGLAKYTQSGGWVNLVGDYNSGFNREFVYRSISAPEALEKTLFSTLTFATVPSEADAQQLVEIVVAGRYGRPLRYSYNNGDYWDGNQFQSGQGNSVMLRFGNGNVYPGHQFQDEPIAYTGLNNVIPNPYNSNYWYSTGGASPYRSSDGGIFSSSTWQYKPDGINMTVAYDITINPHTYNQLFFPISDWTLGYASSVSTGGALSYDRRYTRSGPNGASGESYIPNVSRLLYAANNNTQPGVSYAIGGNVYHPFRPAIYKRTQLKLGGPPTIDRIDDYNNTPFNKDNRAFVDGIISSNGSTGSRLLVLYGKNTDKAYPIGGDNDLGVYHSSNSGETFTISNFNNFNSDNNVNAQDVLENSLIPSLRPITDTQLGDLFSSQFNLANDPFDLGFKYLWLEGKATGEGGGFFRSADWGQNWYFLTPVVGPNSYRGEGCLKASNTGKLYLTIRKSGTNDGGLYTSTDRGSNWFKVTTFISAEQVAARDNWVYVYGKKTTDNYPRLYVATDNGSNTFSSWNEVNNSITSVRALTFNPDPCKFELWIATGGLGIIRHAPSIYFSNCVADELVINDTLLVHDNIELDRDIVIKPNGKLIIGDSCKLTFGLDHKLIVEEGGSLVINNTSSVKLTTIDGVASWGGVEFKGTAKGHLKNCTFENTNSPIRIIPGDTSVAISDTLIIDSCTFNSGTNQVFIETDEVTVTRNIKITNNTFNLPSGGEKCIYAENIFNVLIKNNTFNTGTGSFGIHVKNSFGVDPMSESPSTFVNIVGNTFYGGTIGMALMNAELIQYYVAENTFAGTANGYYGIITKKVYGRIKNNRFNNTNINQALRIDLSDVSLFNNAINGNEDNINVLALSTVNMAPIISGEDFVWEGGANWVTSNNSNNIAFNGSALPLLDYGKNCFNLLSPTEGNHLLGASANIDNIYQCRNNGWTHITPERISNIDYGSTPIVPALAPTYNCATTPTYDGYTVRSKGNGIGDTVWTSETGELPEQDVDEMLYNQSLFYIYSSDYVNGIYVTKSLIDNHVSSSYLIDAIWNMYASYNQLDTAGGALHDELFSELKIYLENVISSGNYDESVESAAYSAVLMCEADLKNFNDAMDGYEFLAEYHPDPIVRLNASWDYEDLAELLGEGGSQKSENLSFEEYRISRLNRMSKIISGDPLLQKLKANYDENIINKYNATQKTVYAKKDVPAQERNTIEKKIYTQQQQTLMQRSIDNIRGARTRSKAEKEKKLVEDLILSGGMNPESANTGENTVPQEYKLHQNYPNPFNPATTIKYQLPKDGLVQIKVYDIIGREVMTLVNEQKTAGTYETIFNATNFASGIYFYRIQSGSFVESKRMMLIK